MENVKKANERKAERGNRAFSIIAGILLSFSAIGAICSVVTYVLGLISADVDFYVRYMGWGWTFLKIIFPFIENEILSLFNILLFTILAVLVFCNQKTIFSGVVTLSPAVVMVLASVLSLVTPLLDMSFFNEKGQVAIWLIAGNNVLSKLAVAMVWALLAIMLLLQSKRGAAKKQKWMRFVCFFPALLWGGNLIVGEIVVVAVEMLLGVSLTTTLLGIHLGGSAIFSFLLRLVVSLPGALPFLFFGIWIVSAPRKTVEDRPCKVGAEQRDVKSGENTVEGAEA